MTKFMQPSFSVYMMANSVERKCPVCLKAKTIYINGVCNDCDKKIKEAKKS